jgi:hypothetical protein
MKITKEQLKEIIKEELSTLEEGAHQFTVGQLQDLMMDASRDGKLRIQLDGSGPDLDILNGRLQVMATYSYQWSVKDENHQVST